MKRNGILILIFSLLLNTAAHSFEDFDFGNFDFGNFEDFDFGGMDFGNMDFGPGQFDFDDGGSDYDSLFGNSSSAQYSDEPQNSESTAKKSTVPEPKTTQEAFKNTVDDKVKKLTTTHKKAITEYLKPISVNLHALITHCSSFALGAKLKADLNPSVETASECVQLIDKIHTNSIYHRPLLLKEFASLREKLMGLAAVVAKTNKKFAELNTALTESLELPTPAQQKKQKQVFQDTTSVITKNIAPLIDDLKKVISHKTVESIIAEKRKKHAPRVSGSYAQGAGGWSNSASHYFNDGFSDTNYGYKSNSWGGGDDFWASDFGSNSWGNDWGNSWGGGWDSYGSSYDYGSGNDWGSSFRDTASSNTSSGLNNNFTVYGNSKQSSSYDAYDLDDEYTPSTPRPSEFNSVSQDISSLPVKDQIAQHMTALKKQLDTILQNYTEEKSPAKRIAFIKNILEQESFSTAIKHIIEVIEYMSTMLEDDGDMNALEQQYKAFKEQLLSYIPLMIHAATYASPPFELLFEEKKIAAEKKVDGQKARAIAENKKRQRLYSYQRLMQLLSVMRTDQQSPLFEAVVDNLLIHAQDILDKLTPFSTAPIDTLMSLNETVRLTTLSRQLYHEPIVIGYAALKQSEDEELTAARTKKLAPIKEKKESLSPAIAAYVQAQYALSHALITSINTVINEVRSAYQLTDEQPLNLDAVEVLQLFSSTMQAHLTAQYSEPQRTHFDSLLLPYSKSSYQEFEVQHGLLHELMKHWSPESAPETTDSETEQDQETSTDEYQEPSDSDGTTLRDFYPEETNASTADTFDQPLGAPLSADHQIADDIETQ